LKDEHVDTEILNAAISDKASASFSVAFGLGLIITPLVTGWLKDTRGFRFTTDFLAIWAGILALFWILAMVIGVCCVSNYWKKVYKIEVEMKELG